MEGEIQKPSRYHSVRKAQTEQQQQQQQQQKPETESGVQRKPSRYHSRPKTGHGANDEENLSPPPPQVRSPDIVENEELQGSFATRRPSSHDGSSSRYADTTSGAQDPHGQPYEQAASSASEEEERGLKPRKSQGRSRHHDQSRSTERRRTESPRQEQSLPRSNKPDVRFDQAPQTIHARREGKIGPQDDVISGDESGGGCFSGFFRKRKFDPIKNPLEKQPVAPRTKDGVPPTIRPGGGGVVPGTDAPISAVNAGDRRVLVECNSHSMLLPVTPETTTMDLMTSAANVFSDPIDVRATVLLEHFSTVGVQRPLRRYEHVRDVMNSWDDDKANSLLLIPTRAAEVNPAGLSASNVSHDKPPQCSFLMHYSQKPGHWEKKLITIREDGQIVMAKDKDKESTNVCHLSDFDIYTPTAKSASKKIKPPKKWCYAIKSQEKTSMFLTGSNFVHFFCASDKTHGTSFYDAVQAWRSWYLVHVMGEGQKRQTETGVRRAPSKAGNTSKHQHHNTTGSIGSHYQLGSFKPMDMPQFERPSSSHSQNESQQSSTNQIPSRKLSVRDRAHPPVSLPKHMLPATQQIAEDEPLVNMASNRRPSLEAQNNEDTFNAGGLLGRSYSTRRRDQQERDDAAMNPWNGGLASGAGEVGVARQVSIKRAGSKRVGGSGAGNTSGLAHRPSTRDGAPRRTGSIDLGRSGSTRVAKGGQPKPLIDLTPKYQPPPQHTKKGKGYNPRPDEIGGPGGALIEAATSGEKTWRDEIPETRDWRGRAGNNGGAGVTGAEMNQSRTRSRSRSARDHAGSTQSPAYGNGGEHRARYASPAGLEDQGFTGTGYLGQAGAPTSSSRGNRNFSSNTGGSGGAPGPLIDITDNTFKQGSLLDKYSRENPGRTGPNIDRDD